MSRRKLLVMCLLLITVSVAFFAVRVIAGDECPPDPGDASSISPILMGILKSLI